MLKLLITLALCLTLAHCEFSCGDIPKRDPKHPPCQALYFRYADEPRRWPAANRVHQCDMLAWSECSQFVFINEAYNPDPMAVYSHYSRVAETEGDVQAAKSIFAGFLFFGKNSPRALCQRICVEGKFRWTAWGTDEAQEAREQCPEGMGNMTFVN